MVKHMTDRKTRIVVILCSLVIAASCAFISFGVEGDPGTASDPVVTKSYVDSVVAQL